MLDPLSHDPPGRAPARPGPVIAEDRIGDAAPGDARVARLAELLPGAPEGVLDTLYGATAPAHVYLLVDATLRAEAAGLFDLDVVDHPAQCLFDGKSARTYGDAAPWLADLSIGAAEATDLAFHRDFFARHWARGTSVLVATDADFDALRRHLRRFVKLPMAGEDRRLFFRFWDPRVLGGFLRRIADAPERARRMMMTEDHRPLAYILPEEDGPVRLAADAAGLRDVAIRPMVLRPEDFAPQSEARERARLARIATRIAGDFRHELRGVSPQSLEALVARAVHRFRAYGFEAHSHQHFFSVWSALYGLGFEERDDTGELQRICRTAGPEAARFRAFRERFFEMDMTA